MRNLRTNQTRGFVMIDALIATVIFAVGILGMMALQATASRASGDAKYRSDAAMLTDKLIAQMWLGDVYNNSALFATGGATYNTWAATIDCANAKALTTSCLPQASGTLNKPTVAFDNTNPNAPSVTITVKWQSPSDNAAHSYVSITQFAK
jgi:type IV pilus assembly protein PilV